LFFLRKKKEATFKQQDVKQAPDNKRHMWRYACCARHRADLDRQHENDGEWQVHSQRDLRGYGLWSYDTTVDGVVVVEGFFFAFFLVVCIYVWIMFHFEFIVQHIPKTHL